MTENELELLRLRMQVEARNIVLEWAAKIVGSSLKPSDEVLRGAATKLRQSASQMTFPEYGAAESDMIAAEFQTAIDDAWRVLERQILESRG